MPPQQLRDYQLRGVAQVMDAFRRGARRVLCVLPTGGGKTTCFSHIVHKLFRSGLPTLTLVHRQELAAQACNRFREFGVDFGVIMSEVQPKPYALAQVASVPTLARRTAFPPARLVNCDEAHLSTAKTWRHVLDQYPNARILGWTASPWRLSGTPLASAYDEVIVIATPRELRELKAISPYVGFGYKAPDLSQVKVESTGEYNRRQAAEAMSQSVIVEGAVEQWGQHARELSTILFAASVGLSQDMVVKFRAVGVKAEHLDGKTPDAQRKAILKRVETGQTRVLCNVGVCVEGIDIPRLKCCIDLAPTRSLSRALQKWGRVRRPWESVTARIHDHAFNIKLHGYPDADRDYQLTAKAEKPPALHQCKQCFAYYDPPSCSCGYERPPSEAAERVIQTVEDAEQFTFESGSEPAPAPRPELPPVEVRWDTASTGRTYSGKFTKQWQEKTDYGLRWFYLLTGFKRDYKLPGTARLDALMRKVQIPDSVFVTYLGMVERRHDFKLEVDDAAA